MLLLAVALVQTVIDAHGIRTPGARIDASGIHTPGASIDANGVHAASAGRGVVILTNGVRRSVDCRGGGLTVNGNRNTLIAVNCREVVVAGNGNSVMARFTARGRVSVVGNDDRVTVRAPRDLPVSTSSVGRRSTVTRVVG